MAADVDYMELLKDESGGLMMEEGITTISIYKGDMKTVSETLRDQLVSVATLNPWLLGRLVSTKTGIKLRYPINPGNPEEIDAIFTSTAPI